MVLKILWLSANLFGYELLKEALKVREVDVVGIITLSEKTKTRIYDGIERDRWYAFGIPVYEIEDINEEVNLIKSLSIDVIIMCGWRQILSEEILDMPKRGVVGFHPTLLPKSRGPAPIINTILCGLKESGLTMFHVDKGIDSGDIIGQIKINIGDADYSMDIYNKMIDAGKTMIDKYLPLLEEGKAPRIPQNEIEATYFPKRSLKDNEIGLEDDIEEIYRKIRAFSRPYEGAFIRVGNKKLIIQKAKLVDINDL